MHDEPLGGHEPHPGFPHFPQFPDDPLKGRDVYHRDYLSPQRRWAMSVTIVGLNGIGRSAALMLATLGVPRLQLIDPETVNLKDLGGEGYLEYDLGAAKCDATAWACTRRNSRVHPQPRLINPAAPPDPDDVEPFDRDFSICEAVLCCSPDREAKSRVWEVDQGRFGFYADARVGGPDGHSVEILATDPHAQDDFDPLLDDSSFDIQATPMLPVATAAACTMIAQLGLYIRNEDAAPINRFSLLVG